MDVRQAEGNPEDLDTPRSSLSSATAKEPQQVPTRDSYEYTPLLRLTSSYHPHCTVCVAPADRV